MNTERMKRDKPVKEAKRRLEMFHERLRALENQWGDKPVISEDAKRRLEMFHEGLRALENQWGVEVICAAEKQIAYVDLLREDDWSGVADWDAIVAEDGRLHIETFDWWGK